MIGAATGQIRTQIKPGSDDLIQLDIPLHIFRHEANVTDYFSAEVQRLDGRRIHQNIEKVMGVEDRQPICGKARHCARWITRKTANVERDFIVEDTNAAAQHGSVTFERRPCKAGSRSKVTFICDPLIFESDSQIKAKVGTHAQAVLREADVLAVAGGDRSYAPEDDLLSECSVLAQDIHRPRRIIQIIADAVEVEAHFNLVLDA